MTLTVNRAKPSSQELQDVFSEHVSCDTLALCVGLRGYAALEKTTGCSVKNVLTEQNHSFFNLNTVNSFHSFIKRSELTISVYTSGFSSAGRYCAFRRADPISCFL